MLDTSWPFYSGAFGSVTTTKSIKSIEVFDPYNTQQLKLCMRQ